MEFFHNLLETTQLPIVSAFVLGLMTAISPCPMATNITAIGFISKDIENKRRVFLNGISYTLGRAITYSLIGLVFFLGADQFKLSGFFQQWGEKFLGPLLIIIGLMMLNIISIKFPGMGGLMKRMEKSGRNGITGALLLGIVFALAFCPYSGVLYFGMLIPMTISSISGLYLPIIFALATGIPVIIFAWLIAYSVGSLGNLYNKMQTFEKWFRKIIALLFIGVGIYYTCIILI